MRGCMVGNDDGHSRRRTDEASAYICVIFGKRTDLDNNG